jgi:amino acid transporter
MTALNYSGLDIVGKSSEIIVFLVIAPFIVLGFMALSQIDIRSWGARKPLADVDWLSFMNLMFWNLNSWDSVSTLAGEVRNPSKLFPRALFVAVILVCPPAAPSFQANQQPLLSYPSRSPFAFRGSASVANATSTAALFP